MGDLAQHPLGQHHLIGCGARVYGQELDLLLDHLTPIRHEVTDLGVGVFDGAPHAHQVEQGLGTYVLPLRERPRLVVATLGFDPEQRVLRGEEVVLEFAEGLEGAACLCLEGALSLAQDLLRGRGQGRSAHIVETAQELHRGDRGERVEERGGQARYHVQVGGRCLDEGEERGSVDALTEGEDAVEMCLGLNRKVKGLEPTISADVAKVEHRDPIVFDVSDDVGLRELLRGLP